MLTQSFFSLRSSFLLYSRKKRNDCQCHRIGAKNCQSDEWAKQREYFERDIDDIADSVMEVMCICGLRSWIVKKTREAIKRSLRHYDETRYRIDRVPRKRFCKESFIFDLSKEAGMSRIDGQLAYSIVKRAFKAYYHGTALEGRRLQWLADNMKHRQECLWLHAAKRTAEIYAAYTGLMYSEQLMFQERFECVYKCLYDVLQSREVWEDNMQCVCPPKNTSVQGDTPFGSNSEVEVLFKKQSIHESELSSIISIRMERLSKLTVTHDLELTKIEVEHNPDTLTLAGTIKPIVSSFITGSCASSKHQMLSKLSQSTISNKTDLSKITLSSKAELVKCVCAPLQCDQDFDRGPPVITAECSQGPYICRWLPYDSDEEEHGEPFPPRDIVCPTCSTDDLPCDNECTCTCEFCQCRPAYDAGGEEEHHSEKLSRTGLEDYDTDYCWLAPFRDWPRVNKPPEEEAGEEECNLTEALEENALVQCECRCDMKQRAFPHLFTYLAPFRPPKATTNLNPKEQELPEAAEEQEIEDLANKRPPRGISMETYRCWNLPATSISNDDTKDNPLILVLPNDRKTQARVDVTVKKRHHSPTGNRPSSLSKSNTNKFSSTTGSPRLRPKDMPVKPAPPPNSPNPGTTTRQSTLSPDEVLALIGL